MKDRFIAVFEQAKRLTAVSILLGVLAILLFLVFGTLSSLKVFADKTWVYVGFHYLPYALIGLSIPISLYHVFLSIRYRIIQLRILLIMVMLGVGLLLVSPFMAMVSWFSMPYLFRVNFGRYLNFLKNLPNKPTDE